MSVFSIDLDGDSDNDVLSASELDGKIAWYENLGSGNFGPQQVITTNASYAKSVFSIDLDGDGDNDVLSASSGDDKIAWYENLLITSVTEISNTDIKIFPNPTNNIINISYNKEFLLEIYDITGRKLLYSNSTTTDVSQLSKGIYILLIKDKQGVLLEKEKLIVE